MIYDIGHPDPLIYTKLEKFDFKNPPVDPIRFVDSLAQTMLANDGIGLAANQAGFQHRVFLIKAEQIIACYNPMIVDSSPETVIMEEGCLSFPNLIVKVKRPKGVKVRYTEPNGNVQTRTFHGMTARIFQHELDHLDGITMMQRATGLERDRARKLKKKIERQQKRAA